MEKMWCAVKLVCWVIGCLESELWGVGGIGHVEYGIAGIWVRFVST